MNKKFNNTCNDSQTRALKGVYIESWSSPRKTKKKGYMYRTSTSHPPPPPHDKP